jgi:hypothetical protein
MRLFFALSAAIGFFVMGAYCTNAYATSLSPTQPTSFGLTAPMSTGIALAMEIKLVSPALKA